MTLAEVQAAFMAQVLDEEAPLPAGWSARQASGMNVYRNNYRTSLVDALLDTYERTAKWVGESAFRRAAAHHLITRPPSSWTLDHAGAGFDETCAQLFGKDPEVAELAWLEWTMFEVFSSPDGTPLDAEGFAEATADFGEAEWAGLKLAFQEGAEAREVRHDLKALWTALGEEELVRPETALEIPCGCLVWREGERPTFLMVAAEEARAFNAMAQGASFGEVCAQLAGADPSEEQAADAARRAGAMLGRWLHEGLVASLRA